MAEKDNNQSQNSNTQISDDTQIKDDQQKETEETKNLEELEETLEDKLAKMTEMAKRSIADMQNMKRRMDEERIKTILRANINLIEKLLPVLDNLHRALEHKPEGNEEWCNGIEMSVRQIEEALKNSGLEKMESLNQDFNPDFHEAISEGPGEKNKVIQVLEEGYKIQDFVIRHTKVIVGNGKKT